jgi:hypothetical protein
MMSIVRLRGVLLPAAVACLSLATLANAAIEPTDLNYLGAYRPSQDIDAYSGRGSLAYFNDPVEGDVMYAAADDMVFLDRIPAALLPSVVGWGNLNVATNLIGKTDVDPVNSNWAGQGLRIRNDSGTDHLYAPGYNRVWGSADMDLTNAARMGVSAGAHITGASTMGVPIGFIEHVVGDSSNNAHDTLVSSSHNGALRFELTAPQLGDGTTVPATALLWFKSNTSSYWDGLSYVAVEWVQAVGDDWTDAHIVTLEYSSADEKWLLAFYDPMKVADTGPGVYNEGQVAPTDLVDDPSHILALEDLSGFAHSAGFDSASSYAMFGMTYDPFAKLLYINEVSTDSGAGAGQTHHIIHVFSTVPEPATLGLLSLGTLGLTALRRRRK